MSTVRKDKGKQMAPAAAQEDKLNIMMVRKKVEPIFSFSDAENANRTLKGRKPTVRQYKPRTTTAKSRSHLNEDGREFFIPAPTQEVTLNDHICVFEVFLNYLCND